MAYDFGGHEDHIIRVEMDDDSTEIFPAVLEYLHNSFLPGVSEPFIMRPSNRDFHLFAPLSRDRNAAHKFSAATFGVNAWSLDSVNRETGDLAVGIVQSRQLDTCIVTRYTCDKRAHHWNY